MKCNDYRIDLHKLKAVCPLPALLKRMHLGQFAKSQCQSPFRADHKPSWGIYESEGKHGWKDFGNQDGGDEVSFLARYLGLDAKKDFGTVLKIYEHFANGMTGAVQEPVMPAERIKPKKDGFAPGTSIQLTKLCHLRGFTWEAVTEATERGFLVFGESCEQEVYGLTDKSGRVLEVRRLDGELFKALKSLNERKSHAVKGSEKSWPVGILEAEKYPCIALVEGVPDFLAAYQVIVTENALDRVAPVGLLGSGSSIHKDALQHFKGKHVRKFVHADKAGLEGANTWTEQLEGIASKVDYMLFSDVPQEEKTIKDLCDFKDLHAQGFIQDPKKWRILP